MAIWLSEQDFINAVSQPTVLACTDDQNFGRIDSNALCAIIERAENETLSWLIAEYGPPPLSDALMAQLAADPFLKYCALDFGIAHLYDRRPEYVRAHKQDDAAARRKEAKERMERVLDARQRAPTVQTPPANVGGVSVDGAFRLYTDNPGGPPGGNAGDY